MSSRISGFKNKEQEQKLINEYKDNLAQQISNNEKRSVANADYFRNQKLGITPVAPQAKTAEEELLDQTLQNETAYKNLRTSMKDADAAAVMGKLMHDGDVKTFNSFWGKFKKEVEGTAFIYPAFFNAIWERFKEKIAKTDTTGIHIPAEAQDFEILKDRVANFREMLYDNFDVTDNQNRAIVSALTTLLQYGKENSFKVDDVVSRLEELASEGDIQKVLDALAEVSTKNKSAMEKISKQYSTESEAKKIERDRKKADRDLEKMRLQREKEEEEKKIFQEADDAYDELSTKNLGTLYKKFYEVYAKEKTYGYLGADGKRHVLNENKLASRDITHTPLIDYIIYRNYGFNPKAPPPKYKGRGLRGRGLDPFDASNKDTTVDGLVQGKEREQTKKEPNFGKYVISKNLLNRGFLSLRYPSGAVIPLFPKTLISSDLQRLIHDILNEKRFDENDYQKLEDVEKKLFDNLCSFAKVDKQENLKFYRHKKYSDEQRNADIKRFNILKGEILAGQDSPEVVKELRKLLYKLLEEKVITLRDYTSLIHRLLLLD